MFGRKKKEEKPSKGNFKIVINQPKKIEESTSIEVIDDDTGELIANESFPNSFIETDKEQPQEVKLINEEQLPQEIHDKKLENILEGILRNKFGLTEIESKKKEKEEEIEMLESLIEARREALAEIENELTQLAKDTLAEVEIKAGAIIKSSIKKFESKILRG